MIFQRSTDVPQFSRYQDRQKLTQIRRELEQVDIAPEYRQMLWSYLEEVQEKISPPVSRQT